jgi:hypothetical protein
VNEIKRIHLEVECCNSFGSHRCTYRCGAKLTCGHTCKDTCGNCAKFATHLMCMEDIKELALPCGHETTGYCCGIVNPCAEDCEFACEHRKCRHSCAKVCTPCEQPCTGRVNIRNARKHVQNFAIVRRVTSHARFCCRARNTNVLDFVVNHVLKVCFECQPRNFRMPSDWPRQS